MIYILILIGLGATGTVFMCQSIASGFETKNEILKDRVKELNTQQTKLRQHRKELQRELGSLKNDLKNINSDSVKKSSTPKSLKDWLIQTRSMEDFQLARAEKYAEEKNLGLISALLTLNMITVDVYEEAKRLKLN